MARIPQQGRSPAVHFPNASPHLSEMALSEIGPERDWAWPDGL